MLQISSCYRGKWNHQDVRDSKLQIRVQHKPRFPKEVVQSQFHNLWSPPFQGGKSTGEEDFMGKTWESPGNESCRRMSPASFRVKSWDLGTHTGVECDSCSRKSRWWGDCVSAMELEEKQVLPCVRNALYPVRKGVVGSQRAWLLRTGGEPKVRVLARTIVSPV